MNGPFSKTLYGRMSPILNAAYPNGNQDLIMAE